jgi:hypothetical protein
VVSKLISGTNLRERIAQGIPSQTETVQLITTMASALMHVIVRGSPQLCACEGV